MITFLQSKWAALTVGVLSYAATTWLCLQPQKQFQRAVDAIRAAQAAALGAESGPSWTFHNPELVRLLSEIKDERENLRKRATQLDELEARLNAERQEICVVTQTVYRLRSELDETVTRVTQEETANLKKLAKVYADMTPEGAGRILRVMDDSQIVKILAMMKDSETAPIIENLSQGTEADAKRAALISNRLRLTLLDSKNTTPP
jgi:flagellar motility protein MotE (MotC chaperone)